MGSHPSSLGSASPRLVIIEGKDKGKVIQLKKGTAILGRSKGDILVQDPRVSRSHVAIHFDELTGELSYTDLKSLNGVIINGELRETGVLKDGDKLQLGNTLFDCQLSSEGETEAGTFVKSKRGTLLNPDTPTGVSISLMEPAPASTQARASNAPIENTSNSFQMDPLPPDVSPAGKSSSKNISAKDRPTLLTKNSPKSTRKSLFSRIPPKLRMGALALIISIGLLVLWPTSPTSPAITSEMDKQINAVQSLIQEKNWSEAQVKAQELVKKYPAHSVPAFLLGDIYAEQKKTELASDFYRKAHSLQPPQLMVHTKLVRMYLLGDKLKEAEDEKAHIFEVLKSGPTDPELYIKTAELYLEFTQLKSDKEKMLVLAQALQNTIAPKDGIGYKLEAHLIMNNDKSGAALTRSTEVLEKGLRLAPKDEWLLEKFFFAKLSQNNNTAAMEALNSWMKIHPDSSKPMLIMGYLKFNDKNFLAAVPYLQKVIQLLANNTSNPHFAEALHLMGQIYLAQNQIPDAENFLKDACKYGFQESCSHPLVAGGSKEAGGHSPASEAGPESPTQNQ